MTGTRNLPERYFPQVEAALALFPDHTVLIQGKAKGVDTFAGNYGLKRGWEVLAFPANWSLGKAAGMLRNDQMLREGRPTFFLAFHTDPLLGRGTRDMVMRLNSAKVPGYVWVF